MALIDLLPPNFEYSAEVVELQGAFNTQVEAIAAAKEDFFRQLDANTATWCLKYWEKAYGLKTDISKPYIYRRTRILSKMRGQGSATKAMIKNTSESFSNGEVDIIEDNSQYTFTIKFIGARGIPPNLDDLKNAIEEIKPAHLAVIYLFTYLTWNEFDSYNNTWNEWDDLNLTWDELEVYREVI